MLSRQKNQSMACLINNNVKKVKADDIYSKIINDQFNKTKNTQMKILQKVKNAENNKFIKKIEKINKYFNNSIYNMKNQVNMPLIYDTKNRSENKVIKNSNERNNNNEFKRIKYVGTINKRNRNMNSTIGFQDSNKYLKYYLLNNYENNILLILTIKI